uniref:Uncharacterized protein n=1 Tax=Oryza barthii TaxID=65489 RepID=A0A0D3F2K2_9ORYZ
MWNSSSLSPYHSSSFSTPYCRLISEPPEVCTTAMKAAVGLHHIELGTVCGLEGFKRTLASVARSSAVTARSDASVADLAKVDWEHVDVH